MNERKLKIVSKINTQKPITEKKNMKYLINKKEENKTIHIKQLIFNPDSYFKEKYSQEIPRIINGKKILNIIVKNSKKDNNTIDVTTKKLKLKPINVNRSNFSILFPPKVDDILIPSNQTSKDIVDYNKSNAHNTLLNYYHKNDKNKRIINFIKTNSSEQNLGSNLTNKFISSNESYNINNSNTINIQNNNDSLEKPENILKRHIKMPKSFSEAALPLKLKKNFRKSKVEMYESEMVFKREILRNLNYFHDYFFINKDKEEDKKYFKKLNPVFKEENHTKSNQVIMINSFLKEKITLDNLNKNKMFSPNFKKTIMNKKIINKSKNDFSYRKMRTLSIKGFKRMKADKKKQFDLRIKKTNNEVLNLEHKLDELLEVNKQLFLNAGGF